MGGKVTAASKGERTHARIVQLASRIFRRDGYQSTGIDGLMAEVGLTRGGFYAHFRDKRQLLIEALRAAFAQSHANLFERGMKQLRGRQWVEAAAARYLDARHRASRASGCPVPSLGAEVARAPRAVRRAFGLEVGKVVDAMAARLDAEPGEARQRAWALLASWAGAIVLARAIADDELADELLAAVKHASLRIDEDSM